MWRFRLAIENMIGDEEKNIVSSDHPGRVFVVGLDGATFDLLRPWMEAGHLPTLEKLAREGCTGRMTTTVPPVTAPAWTSFMTGKNPGKHGLYDFRKRTKGSYDFVPVSSANREGRAIWDIIGQAGRRVIVVNVPMTYPPQPVNGLMITGMLTPRGRDNFTHPSGLQKELEEKIGKYIIFPEEVYAKGQVDGFLGALYQAAAKRLEAVRYLMQAYPWDFFMVVFNETDVIQHGLWSCMDADHPRHDPAESHLYGDAILKFYQWLDRALTEIMAELDSNTLLMVMSDHGAGPLYSFMYANNLLADVGLLQFKKQPLARLKRLSFKLGVTPRNVYGLLLKVGLGRLRRSLDKRRGGYSLLKKWFLSFSDVDWSRTEAYSVGPIGQIYINLKGREPQGIVHPGKEYERVRTRITDTLETLSSPGSGESLIKHIYKKEELYWGKHLNDAPDIVFLPRKLETVALGDFEFPSNCLIEPAYGISAHHRMEGILLLSGKNIRSGVKLHEAEITDLAPTILYALDLPIPDDMDGKVLTQVFDESALNVRPVRYSDSSSDAAHSGLEYTEEDEEEIVKRLRGLGYLG
jgi:predicted AlkP superfamily phosphohydrolase/phosphomutase